MQDPGLRRHALRLVSERAASNPAGREIDRMERQRRQNPNQEEQRPSEYDERYRGQGGEEPQKRQGNAPEPRRDPEDESDDESDEE